ncbi:MAG TPA: carboxypeptidase M32 [Gaiellaceae bacterium]|nr:carboxypeptidase M32 [Gaiellaceae bacterium]
MSEDRYAELRDRLCELWDLAKLGGLAGWDQQTMMPPLGAAGRAHQLATLSKVVHAGFVSDELGELLEELRPYEESLDYDSDEASLIRVSRRDRDKEVKVPGELREAQTRAGAEAFPVWVEARRTNDFELFRPYLERNVELRREYASCFEVDEPYDALLDDFEPGMKTAEVREVFARLRDGLVPLIAEASEQEIDDSVLRGRFPVEAQRELEQIVLGRYGFRDGSWRIDPVEHPFAASFGTDDIRMTSRYPEDELSGVFAAMHEGGHAIYEHNVSQMLERTPLCRGVSLALHESQSRMFENLVGRGLAWWSWAYPEVQRLFPQLADVELDDFHRAINKVQPSLIRIEADEATYSLHVILRFELEQELIDGSVAVADLPRVWNERMQEYLGVEVPDDAHGVLQDVHWSRGTIGYFPTYALGNVISVQIWEKVLEDVPDLDEHIGRGDLAPLGDWLRERLWRHGRKFTPQEMLERVVGGGLDPEPYLRYLNGKLGALTA